MENQEDKDEVFVDTIEDVKYVVSLLDDINQPINTQLSSILQVCCMLSGDLTVVEYLLEHGANPNYMDYRGWTARDYAAFNKNPFASLLLYAMLDRYEEKFPKENAFERRKQILDWALDQQKQAKTLNES
ncbi:MAG: ankyrin repeat domain-containing protein [Alphaproteobacteria bacterium]|nr:ankyrin repeat domain-containing protein [Alphaproteobacteria bacterium]